MIPTKIYQLRLVLIFGVVWACQTNNNDKDNTTTISDNDTDTESESDTATEQDSSVDEDTDTRYPPNFSSGCGSFPIELDSSIVIDGETRTYELSLPSNYDPQIAYPLIFAWHGRGGSGLYAKSRFGLQDRAASEAIIVYPDGLPQQFYGGDTG